MSTENDVARSLRSWLRENRHEDADRVLDAVFDQVPATPQRSASWLTRRFPPMNSNFVRVTLVAAAAVVIAVVGFQFLGNSNTGGPTPTATPEPTSTPVASAEPSAPADGSLPVGSSHALWDHSGALGIKISVTIPAPGWFGDVGKGVLEKNHNADAPDGAGLSVFARTNDLLVGSGDVYVYGDPCHWATTKPDDPVTSVDEAVAVLSSLWSRDASAPVDITVGGHGGKSITLHVPDDAVFSDCDRGEFRTFVEGEDSARYHQDPGQIDQLWVLDLLGELVIIDAGHHEGTPQSVLDEIDAIVESATLGYYSP